MSSTSRQMPAKNPQQQALRKIQLRQPTHFPIHSQWWVKPSQQRSHQGQWNTELSTMALQVEHLLYPVPFFPSGRARISCCYSSESCFWTRGSPQPGLPSSNIIRKVPSYSVQMALKMQIEYFLATYRAETVIRTRGGCNPALSQRLRPEGVRTWGNMLQLVQTGTATQRTPMMSRLRRRERRKWCVMVMRGVLVLGLKQQGLTRPQQDCSDSCSLTASLDQSLAEGFLEDLTESASPSSANLLFLGLRTGIGKSLGSKELFLAGCRPLNEPYCLIELIFYFRYKN